MLKGWRYLGSVGNINIYQQNTRYVGVVRGTEPEPTGPKIIFIYDIVEIDLLKDTYYKNAIPLPNMTSLYMLDDVNEDEYGYEYISLFDSVSLEINKGYEENNYTYISLGDTVNTYLVELENTGGLDDNLSKYIGSYNVYHVNHVGLESNMSFNSAQTTYFRSINMSSVSSIGDNWETYTTRVASVDIKSFLDLFGAPPVPFSPMLEYYQSFSVYKYPFIIKGNSVFNNFGENGGYSLNGSNKLNIDKFSYKYKYYVYMGMNNYSWQYTLFGNNIAGFRQQDFWQLIGIDKKPDIDVGVDIYRYKSPDPFSKEWENVLVLYPDLKLYFPNLLGLSLKYLANKVGGKYGVRKGATGSNSYDYILNPKFNFRCFEQVYNSSAWKKTVDLNFDKYNIYDEISIPSESLWCPEYVYPWGEMFVNKNNHKVDVYLSAPTLGSSNHLNVLTKPGIPIMTKTPMSKNYGYYQTVYFIFPCVE